MNNEQTTSVPQHPKAIWRLMAWHLTAILLFAAGMNLFSESLFGPADKFRSVRIGLWGVNTLTLITVMGFIHYYLLRQSLRVRNVPVSDDPFTAPPVQEIWLELVQYPYRMASSLVLLSLALMIIMNSVYHVLIGASFVQGLTAMLAAVFFLILWTGPLAVLIYVKSESAMRGLHPLIFTPDQWGLVDWTDTRHHTFHYRYKQLVLTMVPLVCFLVALIMVYSVCGTFLHPFVAGLFIVVILYHVVTVWLTSGSVTEPVRAMESVISHLTRRKKLSVDAQKGLIGYTQDEIGRLNHAVFQLCERVVPALMRYQEGQNELSVQLADITEASRQQSTVSYGQASALSELAATMEEIVQSVNQMASDAMRTSQMTQQGLQEIERGRKYLEQTLDSIDQIYQESMASSQRIMDLSLKMVQIEDVVRIINYVTDHTKILAFNAAIETASAGEVGERFGVVAKEIRQLAQNISDSTEEIKKIINDVKKTAHASVITTEKELKQVNASIRNASDAQLVFNEIHAVIRQASEAVGNISAAINQQRVVHEQVWSSIKDIDMSARELLRKSQSIVEVAERLKNTVPEQ